MNEGGGTLESTPRANVKRYCTTIQPGTSIDLDDTRFDHPPAYDVDLDVGDVVEDVVEGETPVEVLVEDDADDVEVHVGDDVE